MILRASILGANRSSMLEILYLPKICHFVLKISWLCETGVFLGHFKVILPMKIKSIFDYMPFNIKVEKVWVSKWKIWALAIILILNSYNLRTNCGLGTCHTSNYTIFRHLKRNSRSNLSLSMVCSRVMKSMKNFWKSTIQTSVIWQVKDSR